MRMKIAVTSVLFALTLLCGCERGNAILVLDEQWSLKQAQADCQSRSSEGVPPCTVDPIIEIRSSEAQISGAFRVEPACHGITLVTLNVSDDPHQLNSRHTRWLFVELIRTNRPNDGLRFTITRSDNPRARASITGQGQPKSITKTSCDAVRGMLDPSD
jgi:hypothetical protein